MKPSEGKVHMNTRETEKTGKGSIQSLWATGKVPLLVTLSVLPHSINTKAAGPRTSARQRHPGAPAASTTVVCWL